YGTAGDHDAGDFFVLRCRDVGELQKRADGVFAPRTINFPERIRVARAAVENADTRPRQDAVRETAAPLDHRVLRRIVEYILRSQIHELCLRAVDRGVAHRHVLGRREPGVDGRFYAREPQAIDVSSAEDVVDGAAHEVDAVALAPVKQGDISPQARRGYPL